MLIYKTIKSMSMGLAKFEKQDELMKAGRWIFHERDFTQEEWEAIKENANKLEAYFKSIPRGESWDSCLTELRKLLPAMHLGFKVQDAILCTLNYCGACID